MVYAHTVNRITLSGTMFGGVEEWSTGFFLGQEGSDAAELSQAGLDVIRNAWSTFFSGANTLISNNYRFTQAKSALIDASGHTILDSVKYSYPTGTVLGASTLNHHPPQCSLVVTLLSDRPRGLASKGRMFLPGFAGSIAADGKIQPTDQVNIANNLKTFFDAFAAHFDVTDQLILASRGKGALPGLTAQNDYVESIRLGNVVDTQRRRRNGLQEVYSTRALM